MGTSSIHIKAVKSTSESHNLRLRDFDYVRKDLTSENFNWGFETKLSELRQEQEKLYQEKVGQKMQKKTEPIREGVFLFEKHHTNDQLLKVVQGVEKEFGIKAVQLSVHRDEGHYEKHTNLWKPNLHAHVVFDYQNKNTGKTFKLRREELSKLQTYFAEGLGMERGKKSLKTHVNALSFKIDKQLETLTNLKIETDINEIKNNDYLIKIQEMRVQLEELEKEKNKLLGKGKKIQGIIQEMAENYKLLNSEISKRREIVKAYKEKFPTSKERIEQKEKEILKPILKKKKGR